MQTEAPSFSLRAALAGSLVAMLTMITVMMVLGALFYFWELPAAREQLIHRMAIGLAYLVGGAWSAARAGRRGWLHGLMAGLFLVVPHLWLARAAGSLVGGVSPVALAALALLAALLGGVSGVNLGRRT